MTWWSDGWALLRAHWYLRSAQHLGARVRLWGRPVLKNEGTLIVGERARLVSRIAPLDIFIASEGTLEIGTSAFINYGCTIAASRLIHIGARCNLGTYVTLMDNDFHQLDLTIPARPSFQHKEWSRPRHRALCYGTEQQTYNQTVNRGAVCQQPPPFPCQYSGEALAADICFP